MDELGPFALKSTNPVFLSSVCTVFAESEIIPLLSAGMPAEDIAMGILESMAKRVVSIGRQAQIAYGSPSCGLNRRDRTEHSRQKGL